MDSDYFDMMNHIENDTDFDDIPRECELKQLKEFMDRISVVNLDAGTQLIVKDESEILIPINLRKQMLETSHFTHSAAESMIGQCKRKIFWPGMKKSMQTKYEECKQCQEHKASQATPHKIKSTVRTSLNILCLANDCRSSTRKKEITQLGEYMEHAI